MSIRIREPATGADVVVQAIVSIDDAWDPSPNAVVIASRGGRRLIKLTAREARHLAYELDRAAAEIEANARKRTRTTEVIH